MKTAIIQQRVADFLKQHPPFQFMEDDDIALLAGNGKISFHESDEYLFHKGEQRSGVVWVVQQGTVELRSGDGENGELHDLLAQGEVFGVGSILGSATYLFSARTASDVILYSLDAAKFAEMMRKYPVAGRYVRTRFSVRSDAGSRPCWLDLPLPPPAILAKRARPGVAASVAMPRNVGEGFAHLMRAGGEAIAVGDPQSSAVEGVLLPADLALACGRDPLAILRAIEEADSFEELAFLRSRADALIEETLTSPNATGWLMLFAHERNCRLLRRAIAMVEHELPRPDGWKGTACAWVFFGAAGRGELLTPDTPDCGIVYDDTDGDAVAHAYFERLWGGVQHALAACGLRPYVAQAGAGDGERCRSLSAWKQYFSQIIADPLLSVIHDHRAMLDMQFAAGERGLVAALKDSILAEVHENRSVIAILANDAMVSLPPLTFFQDLVVALDGSREETVDLRKTALDPLADVGRVFALALRQISISSSIGRLELAAAAIPLKEMLLQESVDACRIVLHHQAQAGLQDGTDGSLLRPSALSRADQQLLKTAFRSIHRLLEYTWANYTTIALL